MDIKEFEARYPAPLRKLAERETELISDPARWPRYEEWGIGREHVPDLVRMATDVGLIVAPPFEAADVAQIHASRALAQFGAVEVVQPLIDFLCWLEEEDDPSDWQTEEFPAVMGMLGPEAIEPLGRLMLDPEAIQDARALGPPSVGEIARHHPDTRARVVDLLRQVLRACGEKDVYLATFAVNELASLKATEALDEIRGAFSRDLVDYMVLDWTEMCQTMGIEEARPEWDRVTPEERQVLAENFRREMASYDREWAEGEPLPAPRKPATKSDKARKKKAEKRKKKDRKRNRR